MESKSNHGSASCFITVSRRDCLSPPRLSAHEWPWHSGLIWHIHPQLLCVGIPFGLCTWTLIYSYFTVKKEKYWTYGWVVPDLRRFSVIQVSKCCKFLVKAVSDANLRWPGIKGSRSLISHMKWAGRSLWGQSVWDLEASIWLFAGSFWLGDKFSTMLVAQGEQSVNISLRRHWKPHLKPQHFVVDSCIIQLERNVVAWFLG